MGQVKISDFIIGSGCPPFIVAEAGINHNGDLNIALEMIHIAKISGANAIKFQTFKADEFVGDPNQTYTYRSQGKEITEFMMDMFKRYEFSRNEWFTIKKRCDEEGILFLSTPQNRSDLNLLLEIGIPAIKVGSDDFTNLPLLHDYAMTSLPMFVSCGMADLAEVYQALDATGAFDGYPVVLMLCTSQYPTPPQDVNLLKLKTLAAAFPMVVTGFSDHTQGPLAASLAVAIGACAFEKHFTLDHGLSGPDHWFSEDIEGLRCWIDSINTAFKMMGSGVVKPNANEEAMRLVARRSITALYDIEKGEFLTDHNIGLKRPGCGLPPSLISQIHGLKATKKISKGSILKYGDFENGYN
jgi:sialic acid synthase SpsE